MIKVIDTQTGEQTFPLMTAGVLFNEDRQNQGFAAYGQVYVFPIVETSQVLCFHFREKHYHIPVESTNAEQVLEGIRFMMSNEMAASAFAEKLLHDHWDEMSDPERDGRYMIVNPQDLNYHAVTRH